MGQKKFGGDEAVYSVVVVFLFGLNSGGNVVPYSKILDVHVKKMKTWLV